MKDKIITAEQAAEMIKDGSSVMLGGFMANGTSDAIVSALVERDAKDLTVICNDGGFGPQFDENGNETVPPKGNGKLIKNHSVKKLIATHIGLNKQVAEQMNNGSMQVELVPQGSMAEMIRAGGSGRSRRTPCMSEAPPAHCARIRAPRPERALRGGQA